MPAIILFNRGWQFSSDDLVFSSILVIFLRSLCIPFTLAPLIIWDHSQPYVPTNLLEVVYFGIAIDVVQIIVRSALAIASSRGGISEVDKRRPVVPIFYLYLFLIVLEISVYSTAIYLEASYSERHANVCFFLRVVCISDLFLLVTNVIVFLISFDSTGHVWRNHPELWCFEESDDSHRLNFDQAHAVVARLWRRRIRCLSCSRSICSRMNLNAKPQSHDAMMLVSDIVGQYFMTNLVASDVLAGLLLLRWQTYQWVGCGRRVPLQRIIEDSDIYDPVTDPPPHSNPPSISPAQGSEDPFSRLASDWLSIRRLWIYSKFASAVYGRLLYVFSHHLSPRASFRLCKHMQCLGGARSCCTCGNEDLNHPETHPFLNQSDDITAGCCICNRDTCNIAVYQEVTGAPIESLVYYSSVNDVYQPPFFVSFDDESEVILVTIRGTLSLEDMIVDMLAEGLSLSAGEMPPDVTVGDIQGYYVHMGILTSARNLRDIILRLQLIEKARLKRPSYPLVVCGHSLGAGVASVLALLLKKYYPEVKGYAFSPPLGLMSANIARYCKSFVVSVILGYDIVSRLSIPTLNDLKWRLLSALRDCKVPKYRLLSQAAGIVGLNCLLPSFCRSTNKSIGLYRGHLDETCQYHLLHPRVLDPRPPPAASTTTYPHSGSGALENCGHSIADASSGGDVTSSAPRPVRYLEEGRSLFRWLRIKTDVLLRTNSSAATCGLLASAVKIPEFSTTITSDSTDFSETSGFCGDLVSMDTNVRFAGLVVHIVEVQDEVTESGGIGVWDRPYERTGGHHPPSRGSHPPPVAIWTNSRQFQSILIHPRMLADHLPSEVTAALYRIFCATCKYQGQLQAESPNSSPLLPGDSVSLDGEALIRRLKKPLR